MLSITCFQFRQYSLPIFIQLSLFCLIIGCDSPLVPPANPAPPAPEISQTDPKDLEGEVLEFTADWCHYCQEVAPIIAELKQQGYPIQTIDTDQHPALSKKFEIDGLPTFVYLIDGQEKARIRGAASKQELIDLWQN